MNIRSLIELCKVNYCSFNFISFWKLGDKAQITLIWVYVVSTLTIIEMLQICFSIYEKRRNLMTTKCPHFLRVCNLQHTHFNWDLVDKIDLFFEILWLVVLVQNVHICCHNCMQTRFQVQTFSDVWIIIERNEILLGPICVNIVKLEKPLGKTFVVFWANLWGNCIRIE